jgi:hypothetical protein
MRKHRIIALASLLGAMLLLTGLALYGRGKPVAVSGQLTPQDVTTIQRDYYRLKRQNVRKALASADPLFLLGALRELAFGRIRRVGSALNGCAAVSTGYVWSTDTIWVCDLVRTTNGWRLP